MGHQIESKPSSSFDPFLNISLKGLLEFLGPWFCNWSTRHHDILPIWPMSILSCIYPKLISIWMLILTWVLISTDMAQAVLSPSYSLLVSSCNLPLDFFCLSIIISLSRNIVLKKTRANSTLISKLIRRKWILHKNSYYSESRLKLVISKWVEWTAKLW